MHTYYLSPEEVSGYAKDFCNRLEALGKDYPYIWCTIGLSGAEIAAIISNHAAKSRKKQIQVVPLSFNRDNNTIYFDNQNESALLKGVPVLVIDSSVHSGTTMLKSLQVVVQLGASKVTSYSLVVKRGACFIPNVFGLLIDNHDRACYLLKIIPNNRLETPFGILRKISEEDVQRKQKKLKSGCGLESLDKTSWSDLWYEHKVHSTHVYIFEQNNEICGFISFLLNNDTVLIDAVAVDKSTHKKGIGGSLIRWVENFARSSNCSSITLWAINERKSFYQDMGYELTSQELDLGEEKYTMMRRELLYNLERAGDKYCSLE